MDCQYIEEKGLLRGLLNGTLGEAEKAPLKAHIDGCESCQGALQLCAALMSVEPVPVEVTSTEKVAEPSPSLWQSLREWLFPQGAGGWQPMVAFAVILVVAVPVLQRVWMPTDPAAGDPATVVMRAGQSDGLEHRLPEALRALQDGEPEEVVDLLNPHAGWDRSDSEFRYVGYRVRARAFHMMGSNSEAMQDLNLARRFAGLDPTKEACLDRDIQAVKGQNTFCPLPAPVHLKR